jgi:hypothetical protein
MTWIRECPNCERENDGNEHSCATQGCNTPLDNRHRKPKSVSPSAEVTIAPDQDPLEGTDQWLCHGEEYSLDEECAICGATYACESESGGSKPDAPSDSDGEDLVGRDWHICFPSGKSLPVSNGMLIGRASSAISQEILIETAGYPGLSRCHAWIGVLEGRLHVIDLNSTNGISIDGRKIEPAAPSIFECGADEVILTLGKSYTLIVRKGGGVR